VGERVSPVEVPELAGLAEVAAILGVSKQRVRELAERDDTFPAPIAELTGGAIYLKPMIEEYKRLREPQPGHPGRHQAQVLQELARIPKVRGNLGQQILRMVYHNIRRHDLSVDPLTPRGQTLFRSIELTLQDIASFKPQYDEMFFQPDPPDKRYVELHSRCCPASADSADPPQINEISGS
jgi:hypothetical protein